MTLLIIRGLMLAVMTKLFMDTDRPGICASLYTLVETTAAILTGTPPWLAGLRSIIVAAMVYGYFRLLGVLEGYGYFIWAYAFGLGLPAIVLVPDLILSAFVG